MLWWLAGIVVVLVLLTALGTPLWIVALVAGGITLVVVAGLVWLLAQPDPPPRDSQG
jgi:hypothetical protein